MMIERFLEVVRDALGQALQIGVGYAGALALGLALVFAVGAIVWAFGKREWQVEVARPARTLGGVVALVFVLVTGWSVLRATRFLAQRELRARDKATATFDALPDAPPVAQTGPALAALHERTYSSHLTLPPSFLKQLGTDGGDALSPYLTAPTSQNVLNLRDSFKKSGRNVVFSRQVTVLEEDPLPFSDARVHASFARLPGRAFDCAFEGHYTFSNPAKEARTLHFLFSLPQAGTVRDLKVVVAGKDLTVAPTPVPAKSGEETSDAEADSDGRGDDNTYEWKGRLNAGETRQAVVTYIVTGARTWNYALGSSRRRVQGFSLDADTGGEVRFARGSLQPTSARGQALRWELSNVVTAQSLSLVFPSDKEGEQLWIQALTALPVCLVMFCGGALALSAWSGASFSPLRLAGATGAFALGLCGATIEVAGFEPLLLLLVAPGLGALAACALLGKRFALAAFPIALVPATFLSAHHTGVLVLMLFVATGVCTFVLRRRRLI